MSAGHIPTEEEQADGIPYKELPLAADWKLPAEKINRLQQAAIDRLVTRCRQAHYVDIVVRINGKYEVHQADWLKHLEELHKPLQAVTQPWVATCQCGVPLCPSHDDE